MVIGREGGRYNFITFASFYAGLLGVGLVLFFPVIPGKQIFLSHVLFLLFCVISVVGSIFTKNKLGFYVLFLLVLALLGASFLSAQVEGVGERFDEDFVKVLLYFVFIPLLCRIYSEGFFAVTVQWFFLLFPLAFFAVILTYSGDLFSYSGRFYVEQFGSPNVFGVFAALALIYLFLVERWPFGVFLRVILVVFYVGILMVTASRSAMLGVFFACFLSGVRSYLKLSMLLLVFLVSIGVLSISVYFFVDSEFSVLQKFNLYEDFTEKGMSYRFDVWTESLRQWWDGAPSVWLFGYGPGKVILTLFSTEVPVLHPHNTFIFFLYSYGFLGFFIFLSWVVYMLACSISYSGRNGRLVRGVLFFYAFIFMFDVHLSASQFIPFHVIFISYMASILKSEGVHA